MARLNNPPSKEDYSKGNTDESRPTNRDATKGMETDASTEAHATKKSRTKQQRRAIDRPEGDDDFGKKVFEPMISATGKDYSKRKGVARYIQKKQREEPLPPRRLLRYVKEEVVEDEGGDEGDDGDEDGDAEVLRGAQDVYEDVSEGQHRRSKRLAEKKKRGY